MVQRFIYFVTGEDGFGRNRHFSIVFSFFMKKDRHTHTAWEREEKSEKQIVNTYTICTGSITLKNQSTSLSFIDVSSCSHVFYPEWSISWSRAYKELVLFVLDSLSRTLYIEAYRVRVPLPQLRARISNTHTNVYSLCMRTRGQSNSMLAIFTSDDNDDIRFENWL